MSAAEKIIIILLVLIVLYVGLAWLVWRCRKRKTKVKLVLYFFINNQFQILKFMKLNEKKFTEAVLGLVDKKTGNKIEGATFTEIKIESSDASVAEIKDADSDGDVDVVPVAVGKTTITVEAVADYTDPSTGDRVVKGLKADPVEIEVVEETEVGLVVNFTEARDLPVVEEPANNPPAPAPDAGTGTGTGDNGGTPQE